MIRILLDFFVNVRVNLTKRVNTPEERRYCPAVVAENGRIKPDWVSVDGKEARHPEGAPITSTTPMATASASESRPAKLPKKRQTASGPQ